MGRTATTSITPLAGAERRSTASDAALYIRRLIFDGDLPPGTRIPQDDIADALGVSRIPVREALIALEREGWVTIELHRGAFVSALDADAVRDHYELYGLLYAFAARHGLERSGPEVIDLARHTVERLDDVPDDDFNSVAFPFHHGLIESARSPRLKVVIRAMSSLVPGEFFTIVPAAISIQRRGLARIARALDKGDGERAGQEYVQMMRRVGEEVVTVFADHGLFSR